MRVLFTTFASKTHMFTQVPAAWALHTAGHEVRVASQPDLVDQITSTGLTAVGVGDPLNLEEQIDAVSEGMDEGTDQMESQAEIGLDMSETRPEKLTPEYVQMVFTNMTAMVFQNECGERMIDDLVAFARDWRPDLVIWDTMTFAGPIAAKACGAAHARLLFGLDLIGRMRAVYLAQLARLPAESRDDCLAEWLAWSAGRHGVSFDEEMVTGQWTIDPVPSSMRFPVDLPYVPVHYAPYNGRAVTPRWLHEPPRRRRVCLTLGMAHREVAAGDRASVADLLEAVADLDVEIVATLNAKQLASLDAVPDNVRAVDYVPLNMLLPTCAAIVHHGGSGTFQTALAHGVPQIIVPDLVWDTIHKAHALERCGAGVYVRDTKRLTGGELRGQLTRLLTEPSFAAAADRIRTELRGTPSLNDIVPVLERLTAEHRASALGR